MSDSTIEKDATRPFYNRKMGELGIYLDIYDAEPLTDTALGSRQFFMMNLSERFNEQLKKQELFKIKGFFEKRSFFKEMTLEYFTYALGCNMLVVCSNNLEAVISTQNEYDSGRLQRCFIECFVSDTLQKKLGVKNLKMKIKIWEDEFEMCRQEWVAGLLPEKYILMDNEKSRKLLYFLKRYQLKKLGSEKGIISQLKDIELFFEQTFADFILCIKKHKENPLVPFKNLGELRNLYENRKSTTPKDGELKLLERYLDGVELISRVVREVETNVWFPLAQIRAGGENAQQCEKKQIIRTHFTTIKAAVRDDFPLMGPNALRDNVWSNKITVSERRIYDGIVCLLPCLLRKMMDVDHFIDEYLQQGNVVIKSSDLTL